MKTHPFNARIKNILILLALTAMFFSAFGGTPASVAFAQEPASPEGISAQALVAGVDLEATDITLTPPDDDITTEFYENDDIDIALTIVNNGDTASGAFNIYFAVHADGAVPDTTCAGFNSAEWDYYVRVTSIDASTAETLTDQTWYATVFANTLTAGDYQVTAFVDSDCEVVETDEGNNVFTTTTFTVNPAPAFTNGNDNFDDAEEITALPFSDSLDPRGATREATDPTDLDCKPTNNLLDAGLATVWYHYTPPTDQNLVLDTIGSGYDTYIAVFETGSPLQFVDCNDDIDTSGSNRQSRLPIHLSGGVKYYFLIGQFSVDETSEGVTATSDVAPQAASEILIFNISQGYEISGNVGASGVTLSYFDGFAKTVTSGSDGKYNIIIPPNWSGTVTPSKAGHTFIPVRKSYSDVTTDLTAQNYKVRRIFRSTATQDGWVLESTRTSSKGGSLNRGATTLRVGDDAANRQYRTILSFNTSSLPDNAIITKVTLRVRSAGIIGANPFNTHGNLLVDIRRGAFSGSAALQLIDFQAAASKSNIGNVPKTPVNGWYVKTWTSGISSYIHKKGITQLRLRFYKGDNGDSGADFLKLYSGDAGAASRPQLIIEYRLP
jgi:hypothetical protein